MQGLFVRKQRGAEHPTDEARAGGVRGVLGGAQRKRLGDLGDGQDIGTREELLCPHGGDAGSRRGDHFIAEVFGISRPHQSNREALFLRLHIQIGFTAKNGAFEGRFHGLAPQARNSSTMGLVRVVARMISFGFPKVCVAESKARKRLLNYNRWSVVSMA